MKEFAWLIWDSAAVCVMLYCVSRCARRGLVHTIVSLLGYIAAAFLAKIGSPAAAKFLYDNVVRDAIRLALSRRLEEAVAGGGEVAVDVLDLVPDTLLRIMGQSGREAAVTSVAADAGEMVETVIEAALRNPVVAILQAVCFLIIFSLAAFLVRYVARLFTGIYRIPVVGSINTMLGGVVGVLQALLILYIAAFALRLLIAFSDGGWWWLGTDVMDSTYIWRVFYNF